MKKPIKRSLIAAEFLECMEDMRFEHDAIDDERLRVSLRERGILNDLDVRIHPNKPEKFQIVDGRRRFRLGLEGFIAHFPCKVYELTDAEAYAFALEKNIQRKNLTSTEIALWVHKMVKEFNLTRKEVVKMVGFESEMRVTQLVQFAEDVLSTPEEERIQMTEKQARTLRTMPKEMKQRILTRAKLTGELPSAREMERQASAKTTPREILEANKYRDEEYVVYMLQEEAGLTVGKARNTYNKFKLGELPWQKTSRPDLEKLLNPDGRNATVQLYATLSQMYPVELLDLIDKVSPAKTVETYRRNAIRFIRALLNKAPADLKQSTLDEFKEVKI